MKEPVVCTASVCENEIELNDEDARARVTFKRGSFCTGNAPVNYLLRVVHLSIKHLNVYICNTVTPVDVLTKNFRTNVYGSRASMHACMHELEHTSQTHLSSGWLGERSLHFEFLRWFIMRQQRAQASRSGWLGVNDQL